MRLVSIALILALNLIPTSYAQDSGSARSSPHRARRAVELTRAPEPSSFFPLSVGNSWLYDVTGFAAGQPAQSHVAETGEFGGLIYQRLAGQANGLGWVRLTADGRLLSFDPETTTESLIYHFGAAEGTVWLPEGPAFCNGPARTAERSEKSLTVRYDGGRCTDAGIIEETFESGVGLVSRREITIGGERRHDLRQAIVAGEWVDRRGLSTSLALDRRSYNQADTLHVRLAVSNSSGDPLVLRFPSGQRFDFAINDSAGSRVYTWSANKLFTQETGEIQLDSGERVFAIDIPADRLGGGKLRPGVYSLEGWLTTAGGGDFGATVGFEIVANAE